MQTICKYSMKQLIEKSFSSKKVSKSCENKNNSIHLTHVHWSYIDWKKKRVFARDIMKRHWKSLNGMTFWSCVETRFISK